MNHLPSFSPREIVKVPERVQRQDKIPYRQGQQVNQHPEHVDDFARRDENEDGGQTKDSAEKHDWNSLFERLGWVQGYTNDQCVGEGDGDGKHDRSEQVHEHHELHAEAERSTQVSDKNKLHQVVDGRIDPSTPLREEHGESIRDDRSAAGLRQEHHLSVREGSNENRRQKAIFAQKEQVLLM